MFVSESSFCNADENKFQVNRVELIKHDKYFHIEERMIAKLIRCVFSAHHHVPRALLDNIYPNSVRERFQISKGRFIMAFAVRGGGGSDVPFRYLKEEKTISNHYMTAKTRFALNLRFISRIYTS